MASNQKRRFIVVGGVIVIVLVCLLAFIGSGTNAKPMSVADAASGGATGQRVEVTGNVVADSYDINGDILTFAIADTDDPTAELKVSYDRGVSATFGAGVTAICTGTIRDDGVLECSELVTKCPSKYESRTDALGVAKLLGYGDAIYGNTVKIQGTVVSGTLKDATADVRFTLADADDAATTIPVKFDGALSDEVTDGASVVLQGSLDEDGTFTATDVSLEG